MQTNWFQTKRANKVTKRTLWKLCDIEMTEKRSNEFFEGTSGAQLLPKDWKLIGTRFFRKKQTQKITSRVILSSVYPKYEYCIYICGGHQQQYYTTNNLGGYPPY